MVRFILLSILLTLLFRAISRLGTAIVRGMQVEAGSTGPARTGSRVPQRGVQMARDPVCGTFVVPDNALALSDSGGARLYFCSAECRDTYSARPQPAHAAAHGRTA